MSQSHREEVAIIQEKGAAGNKLFVENPLELLAVVQSLGRIWLFVTPWTAECQASLSFTIS